MIINLTPHSINEVTSGTIIPASGRVVRIKTHTIKIEEFMGFPIYDTSLGTIEGLPEPHEGTRYLVSALVLAAVPERRDLLAPGNLVRDEKGQPIGCIGFRRSMLP